MIPEVNIYLEQANQWQNEMRELRRIVMDCGLTETFKWRAPCYTFQNKNILIIGNFKSYCTLSFFKGSLLKDPKNVLELPGPHSRHTRLFSFKSVPEIVANEELIRTFIFEAIELEKKGLKVEASAEDLPEYPAELLEKFRKDPEFKNAFEDLTPGRKRGYLVFYLGAKQARTRKGRIDKFEDKILLGKGMHDCTCGKSKRYPRCDGSHSRL